MMAAMVGVFGETLNLRYVKKIWSRTSQHFLRTTTDTACLIHRVYLVGLIYFHCIWATLIFSFLEVRTKENPTTASKWELTDPVVGNRWRQKAEGKRVLAMPLWLYCDDTSGNQSKKWNEHNSFLFTLAGLPGSETSKEYNIHFICTSNLAPPLEMLDGVVQQIEYVFFFVCAGRRLLIAVYAFLEEYPKGWDLGLGL
jgi:hypothetical protein